MRPPSTGDLDETGVPGLGEVAGGAAGPDGAGLESADPEPAALQAAGSVRAVVGRAALIIVAATITGRLLGLFRDIVVAYLFGAQAETDAFFLAYRVPYLLALVVSGTLVAAFVPMFSHRIATGRKTEAFGLFVNVGKVACLVLIALTVILVLLAPWIIPLIGFGFDSATKDLAVYLFRILMIGFLFAGLTGLVTGMLNSLRRFALAAFAPAVGTASHAAHHRRLRRLGRDNFACDRHRGGLVRRACRRAPRYPRSGGALPGSRRVEGPGHSGGGRDGVAGAHRFGSGGHLHLLGPDPRVDARDRFRFQPELCG